MNKIDLNCELQLYATNIIPLCHPEIADKITNTGKQCLNNLYDKLYIEYDEEFNIVPLYRDKKFNVLNIAEALSNCKELK